ncbi:hypothetical protein MKX03_013517, partial [Papaver bracteatum]
MEFEECDVAEYPKVEILDAKDESKKIELKKGMEFDTTEEIYESYRKFGMQQGFGVAKRSSRKDDGILRHVCYTCVRGGNHRTLSSTPLNAGPTSKIGCKAHISARLEQDAKWRISVLVDDHNHELCPTSTRHLRCNKKIDVASKNKLLLNQKAGIRTNKSYHSLVIEAGGYENLAFSEKDARNMIMSEKRMELGEGDAAALQDYFDKMQKQCPGFFYSIDFDDEGCLRNVFWADERCIQAYKEFGEVISFDTTYLTNTYGMPFAPFVGVNHHGQSILLGCGLLGNETIPTFVWLFKTWLHFMGVSTPKCIITDQDSGMKAAVEIVFPHTKHRWCLWHIMKKIPEKLSSHQNYRKIKSKFKRVVYDTQSPADFEKGWGEMFQRYKSLGNSKWLRDLYKDKERWVPCFLKTYFWAGMSTTQRSESMNAFFDKYVTSKTPLKEFVEKYELALRDKIEKELKADAKSFFTIIPVKTEYEMEKQVRSIYTNEKFLEFQMEITKKTYCEVIDVDVVGDSPVLTYHIQEEKWIPKPKDEENACLESTDLESTPENACLQNTVLESIPDSPSEDEKEKIMIRVIYKVSFQKDGCKFECSCHNFEFRGIVCRHAIMVLHRNDIFLLPEKYLLQRWRKDVKRIHTDMQYSSDAWKLTPKQKRYNELCNSFDVLADAASSSDVKFADIKKWIQAQLEVSNFNEDSTCKLNAIVETTNSPPIESKKIRNPPAAPKKGRPKENTPKAKVYTKKPRKGKENAEVKLKTISEIINFSFYIFN